MARVLVAGCGYVGSALAVRLAARGHDVTALTRRGVPIHGVASVCGDLTRPSTLVELARTDFDAAIFTAAPDTSDEPAYRATYVDGSSNLREALGSRARFVLTSTTAVYGQDDGSDVDEGSPTLPAGFRGRVLLEAEAFADVVLRLGGIYGPGRVRALESLRRGTARYRPGRWLNFVHRDDAAGALEHLMTIVRPEPAYIGVDEEPVESEAFYRWLGDQIGVPAPLADTTPGGKNKRCSSARLRASGYSFRYPTFRHGYRELLGGRMLAPCPSSPNCVSSQAVDARHRMSPLALTGSVSQAQEAILETIRSLGGHVAVTGGDYGRAEFASRVFGFIDDVEWLIDADAARVDFRSASRVGHWDFGINRRRMRTIARRLSRDARIFSVCEPA